MSKEAKKIDLDNAIELAVALAKNVHGEVSTDRYKCPDYSSDGDRCFEQQVHPGPFHKYCPVHGKLIELYKSTAYSEQPWRDYIRDYLWKDNLNEDPKGNYEN